jgi:3D (Asp-Asp-Asp) domain-containing protein
MKKIFAIALAALLLFAAGCQWLPCGGDAPSPTWTPGQTDPGTDPAQWGTTAATATDEPPATTAASVPTTVHSWNGICEGDVIIGELTFYCSCEECNGSGCAGVTADGTVLTDLDPGDYLVAGANWLPFNSLVDVDGTVYRIADRGGPGLNQVGRLDIYTTEGHEAALALGRVYDVEVRIVALPGG